MQKQLAQLKDFNWSFNIQAAENPLLTIDWERGRFRYDLLKEENSEFLEAINDKNPIQLIDAIGDMLYILCGTILEYGLEDEIDAIFSEIHRSNMSKLTKDGEVIYTHEYGTPKISKSDQYSPPDFTDIIKRITDNYDKRNKSNN